jgi:hypothetical protein
MEYGAMRVDPKNHYLVWDAIEEVVKRKGQFGSAAGAGAGADKCLALLLLLVIG